MTKLNVPFRGNTEDNTHCFQSALSMVVGYFEPGTDLSIQLLDQVTNKKEGLATWTMSGLIWMKKRGYEVVNMDKFDYDLFIQLGEKYLLDFFGNEVGAWQINNGDIPSEQNTAQEFLLKIKTKKQIPQIDDLKQLLQDGYLSVCLVNSKKLNEKNGYSGHFVAIVGYDDNGLFIHDPGLPPQKNRYVLGDTFERAWAFPDEKAKNLIAFKKQTTF